jgi:DNA-binding transcriptional LysR family regulator
MDEKDWNFVRTVYEIKNITKAADKLHITQPALTYRLQQISEELSIKIFSRSKNGVKFTPEGELLVDYANKMINQLRQLKDQLLNLSDAVKGELRIGVTSNFAHYDLPAILEKFLSHYPEVQIKVITGWSSKILQLLQKEEIHIGIIRGDYEWAESKLLLDEDPLCLISKTPIDLTELPSLQRINYRTDPQLEQVIDTWWKSNYNHPPMVSMEVDKAETCKEMVLKGLGYGIIPHYLLQTENSGLFIHPLTDSQNKYILRKLWMLHLSNEMNLNVVRAFVEYLNENRLGRK